MSSYVNYIKTSKKHIKKLLVFCTPFFHMSITFYTFCQSDMFEVLVVPGGPAKCLYITYSHLAGPAGTSRKLSKFPRVSACALVPRWSLLRLLVPSSSGVMVSFKNLGGPGFSSDEMHTICSIDILTVKFFFPTTVEFRGISFL